MGQALYRKWRPQTWDEVVGQEHIIQTLRNAVRSDRVAHAYLFAGPRGTGKTTTARLLAKAVNCLDEDRAKRPCGICDPCVAVAENRFIDLIEIDAASNTSVDDVRDLRDKIHFSPNEARFKVYIIDEVHMLSTAAFNALLKTLEEPPPHAIFVLATTEVHKIPATVLSRCQRHEFRRLPLTTIAAYLEEKVAAEGLAVEPEAQLLIARQATGSLRDAVSLLDQLASTGEAVTLEQAEQVLGTVTHEAVRSLVSSLAAGEAGEGLTLINQTLDGGADPRQFARQTVDYLRGLLLIRTGNAALIQGPDETRHDMAHQAESLSLDRLLAAIEAFGRAAYPMKGTWQPSLPLELAYLESLNTGQARPEGSRGHGETAPSPPEPRTAGPEPGRTRPSPPAERPPSGSPPAKSPADADAPAARSTPEAAEPHPPPPAEVTFQTLMERWKSVLQASFRRNARTQALLNSSKPLGLERGALVLGFASDLLRDKMEKRENLDVVRAALHEVMGVQIEVRCVLTGKWRPGNQGQAPPPMEDGGMVATALRELGATVVDVQQVPPEEGA